MNIDLPPQQTTNLNNARTNQQSAIEMDDSTLSSDHVSDFIKSMVLRYRIERAIKKNDAQQITTGVQIVDLQSNRTLVAHDENTVHFAASVNKIPIAWLILQDLRAGTITMDTMLTWQPSDVRAGFGVYDQPGAPLQATVGDLLHDMLNPSGNTAVRALVNQGMGGAAAVNTRLAAYPEIPNTRLQPLDANRFYVGNTTAKESVWILRELMKVNDPLNLHLVNAMATNPFTDISVRSQLAGNEYIMLVNKVGLLDDVEGNNRHDVGIIINSRTQKSYAYSLLSTSPYESETATPRAERSLKEMGRSILRFAGDKKKQQLETFGTEGTRAAQTETGRILY